MIFLAGIAHGRGDQGNERAPGLSGLDWGRQRRNAAVCRKVFALRRGGVGALMEACVPSRLRNCPPSRRRRPRRPAPATLLEAGAPALAETLAVNPLPELSDLPEPEPRAAAESPILRLAPAPEPLPLFVGTACPAACAADASAHAGGAPGRGQLAGTVQRPSKRSSLVR